MGDFERVKEAASLKDYAAQHLTPGRERGSYVCPLCDSGTGKNKTAGFKIMSDGMKWHCFSCGKTGDIFDLAGVVGKAGTQTEQLEIVAAWAGVPLGGRRGATAQAPTARAAVKPVEARKEGKGTDTMEKDYKAGRERHRRYIAECAQRLVDDCPEDVMRYLFGRGFGVNEITSLGIGYDPKPAHGWQDEAGQWHNTPRVILPWAGSDYYHIDRAIDDRAKALKYDKPPSDPDPEKGVKPEDCVGAQPLYNPEAFSQDYIVVVEGVLDAMALQLCGVNAVALGGVGSNDFANEAAARKYAGVVVDMLDADKRGREAAQTLSTLMAEAGITYMPRAEYGVEGEETYGGHKDPGEWFAADRDDLGEMMEAVKALALDKGRRVKEADYRAAMSNFSVKDPAQVARDVLELRDVYAPVPTGIGSLDDALGGGLSLGETTFFGAVSSYGKTTLAVQIADYIASRGRSVLFVTIEQSAREIVAKSLSRLVYTENATGWNVATPQEITSLLTRRNWQDDRTATLAKAVGDYTRMIAPNMRILEGTRQPTVNDIRAIAAVMKEHDGQAPIIFIDYLQLLAPLSERYDSDKKNADVNVSELRKMARDLTTHVWCISSLNRSSYSGVISLDSFKESGGIEYGADNLLGLQPRDMAGKLDGVADSKLKREADKIIKTNKAKTERDCELAVLKQRNGALPEEPIPLLFKPMSAYFLEPGTKPAPQQRQKPPTV